MYIELDGDDVAVTYIKDIVFNANRQDVEVLRMVKVLSQSFFSSVLQFVRSLHGSAPSGQIRLRKFCLNIKLLHSHCS